jgi:hypothetical protein
MHIVLVTLDCLKEIFKHIENPFTMLYVCKQWRDIIYSTDLCLVFDDTRKYWELFPPNGFDHIAKVNKTLLQNTENQSNAFLFWKMRRYLYWVHDSSIRYLNTIYECFGNIIALSAMMKMEEIAFKFIMINSIIDIRYIYDQITEKVTQFPNLCADMYVKYHPSDSKYSKYDECEIEVKSHLVKIYIWRNFTLMGYHAPNCYLDYHHVDNSDFEKDITQILNIAKLCENDKQSYLLLFKIIRGSIKIE